ncbi:hypothetical protein [Microbulbifer variabilis]|uniref:hypothetical protein n=1 Tax=Microbulbifer variabilis TaxID=266805 RepID=UPI001CFE724A|nr:hypothetical protein [Microbulbifer variabilis]
MKMIFLTCILLLVGCGKQAKELTPEMESQAREAIEIYLKKNQLPLEGLKPFNSSASSKPDFGFLYTGGGRCIEFVVTCHGSSCTDWAKYPYDEHGEKCP